MKIDSFSFLLLFDFIYDVYIILIILDFESVNNTYEGPQGTCFQRTKYSVLTAFLSINLEDDPIMDLLVVVVVVLLLLLDFA